MLGEGDEEEVGRVEKILSGEKAVGTSNNSSTISGNNKFLLAPAHPSTAASDYCVGDCGNSPGVQSLHHHHHHHTQPQFDPDTQARLVALLEAAGKVTLFWLFTWPSHPF